MSAEHGDWLIWSHEHAGFWGPRQHGYYKDALDAGLYDLDTAAQICQQAARGWNGVGSPPETMIPAAADLTAEARVASTAQILAGIEASA